MTISLLPETPWFVLHTHPAQEDKTASRLIYRIEHDLNREIEVFVPRYQKRISRERLVPRPLFPRYIFACTDLSDGDIRYYTQHTPGLHSIVRTAGALVSIGQPEIDLIRSRMHEGFVQLNESRGLVEDVRVRIDDHPLYKGFEGIFERYLKDTDRVRILLDAGKTGGTRYVIDISPDCITAL